jgi:hypothetical protein
MNGQVMSGTGEEGETIEARETALSSFRGPAILGPKNESGISRTFGRVPESVRPEKRASRTGDRPGAMERQGMHGGTAGERRLTPVTFCVRITAL